MPAWVIPFNVDDFASMKIAIQPFVAAFLLLHQGDLKSFAKEAVRGMTWHVHVRFLECECGNVERRPITQHVVLVHSFLTVSTTNAATRGPCRIPLFLELSSAALLSTRSLTARCRNAMSRDADRTVQASGSIAAARACRMGPRTRRGGPGAVARDLRRPCVRYFGAEAWR